MNVQSIEINSNNERFNFIFRPESIGDKGVIDQIFKNEDYSVSHWKQGHALNRFFQNQKSSKRPLIIDAGANIGAASLYFHIKYRESFIYCIEPQEENIKLLQLNTSCIENKYVFEGAIDSVDGETNLYDPGESDWGFRTANLIQNSSLGRKIVKCISPQSILSEFSTSFQPFIFKIDIEGAEAALFAGSSSWVECFPLIIIELHDWMLPFSGSSTNFLRAIAKYEFDILYRGENIFCFNRDLLVNFV